MISPFQIANLPTLHFGWGCRNQFLSDLLLQSPKQVVLICSPFQLRPGGFATVVVNQLQELGCRVDLFSVSGEPSPDLVDAIVAQCAQNTEQVIGLGGGSVLDAAKAIAGLLPSKKSVMDYLEGVGKGEVFNQPTVPFIALPTTAGTGSETTKNAVLSRLGAFKKSFRSDKLLAKTVWLDPEFLTTCPEAVLYSTGMDAFTQLLESFTSIKANPVTDALAWQGMSLFKDAFQNIRSEDAQTKQDGYQNLMLAASLSGITLANAGLGAVHGLAGPIGAFYEAPHGVVCARLLPSITQQNIITLASQPENFGIYKKYQQVAQLLTGKADTSELIKYLQSTVDSIIPTRLASYGITPNGIPQILAHCRSGSMLGNPVTLTDQQLTQCILEA